MVFEPQHQVQRHLFERGQRELVVVVLVPLVPAREPGGADVQAFCDHDDAVGIVVAQVARAAGVIGIGRKRVHCLRVSNAHKIRSEGPRLLLDVSGVQRSAIDVDHCSVPSAASARAT